MRGSARSGVATWDPSRGQLDLSAAGQFNAVIHLAGDNISSSRWTDKKKAVLSARDSWRMYANNGKEPRLLLSKLLPPFRFGIGGKLGSFSLLIFIFVANLLSEQ